MGSQTVSILTSGVWASLTGGWFFDPKQSHFSNVFHLYVWLVFLCLPFVIQLIATSWTPWIAYCISIGVIFTVIKLVNAYLHRLFDYGECVVEENSATSKEQSDDENFANQMKVFEQNDNSGVNGNDKKENIEMIVIADNTNGNESTRSDSIGLFQKTSSNSNLNHSNNDCNERMATNNATTSVIDLEVDVHHRNSSGSSIGLASEPSKVLNSNNMNSSLVAITSCSTLMTTSTTTCGQTSETVPEVTDNEVISHISAISDINLLTKKCENVDNSDHQLVKGTSLELGFMAQDPAVLRAQTNPINESHSTRKRVENVVRRAHSELETTQCTSDKKLSSVPPSHPVSLEIITTTQIDDSVDDISNNDSEIALRHTTPNLNEKNCQQNNENVKTGESPQNKDKITQTISSSSINSSKKTIKTIDETETQTTETEVLNESPTKKIKSSDCDDGDESDVSLVVNYCQKVKKRKVQKPAKPRRTLNRRNVSKSCSSGKISLTKKSDKVIQFSDNCSANNELIKKSAQNFSSESDIESSRNGSNSYTSRSSSLSSSHSSLSVNDETVPLTAEINKSNSSNSRTTSMVTPLEPKCIAGPSKQIPHELKTNKIRKVSETRSKSESQEFGPNHESKALRHDIQRRRRSSKRSEQSVSLYSQQNLNQNEPNSEIMASLAAALESSQNLNPDNGPPPYMLARILSQPGTHLAKSHEDTNLGAVHVFQDERGNWLTYTFDDNSSGVARGLMNNDKALLDIELYNAMRADQSRQKWNSSSSSSGSTVVLDSPANVLHTPKQLFESSLLRPQFSDAAAAAPHDLSRTLQQPSANSLFAESFPITAFPRTRGSRRLDIATSILFNHSSGTGLNTTNMTEMYPLRFGEFSSPVPQHKPTQYYKLWIFPFKAIKVRFDRLTLLALLDRSLTTFELIASILLAIMVSIFGSILLFNNFFHDLWLIVFCLVIASSQYTLLKSVQPDAASPTHGYNRVTLYSRPVYFCIASSILLLSQHYMDLNKSDKSLSFVIYGIDLFNDTIIEIVRNLCIIFLLSFPLLFSFGLLPQISTFLMYLCEQIDINILGGTAATMGLTSATYSLLRSIIAISLLYSFALVALVNNKSTQTPTFSVFCGLLLSTCYHLSRSSSDPSLYWSLIKKCFQCRQTKFNFTNRSQENHDSTQLTNDDSNYGINDSSGDKPGTEIVDPLPQKLENTVIMRLQSDLILCVFITIVVFATHVSTIFTLQPYVEIFLFLWSIIWGFLLHYILNHFRKQLPWLCFAHPVFKAREYHHFEVRAQAKVMWFEKLHAWLWLIEKNVIYPLVFLSAITNDSQTILTKYGLYLGTLIVVICGFKCLRSTFNDSSHNHIILVFTYLLFNFDLRMRSEAFLMNYFVLSIVYYKFYELLLKVRFVVTYVAPWQITWGSAFHAFAQPFSVPHSAMLFVQALISSILSAPLQPILGSAIFFASYVRPVKFWERDYNTKRVDHSNTRLASQLERSQLGADDNNLNSIFYEHLTRSLQHSLYGDLVLGRWGPVSQGDCFVLASDNLNCLVHIIELGNGLVTFQVRGLEFRGTYCQQREVEAISEGVSEDEGCCCCEPGHIPGMLSINAAFNQRWLSWEVTHIKYVLEGYSISDNSALTMLQPYDLRKALIIYYVKSVIYYCIKSKSLDKWITNNEIKEANNCVKEQNFVELDPIFNASVDEDYDFRSSGITRSSFGSVYLDWIVYCLRQKVKQSKSEWELNDEKESSIVSLCLSLSLLARRALSAASHHNSFTSVEFLLFGLHALFKGDFRITSPKDEWVFQDMDLLRKVIAPAVRMALKLHQDHFMSTEEYDDNPTLYDSIQNYEMNLVISHEADPAWRNAVLSNVPSLLALRRVFDDGADQYKIIMLNKRYLSFRVIKINRECVRGLWAGQQQELIYFRNRNPERGSIQNAKQALRNIINSSCDQPIGYPIYVSPLTTSFGETSEQLSKVIGYPITLAMFKRAFLRLWRRMRTRCGEGCSSGGTALNSDFGELSSSTTSCRRIESIALERVRTSNYSESSGDFDCNQYLYRRSRSQLHAMSYHHYKYSDSKSSSRQASTLVNLSAFRVIPQTNTLDNDFDSILMNTNSSNNTINNTNTNSSNKVIVDKSSPVNSKAELV
ncbi:pecanex-like protein 1 [Oppia nitens]|uniref:pecanex-like protein 1 n=1 Tax=Oppia nitens TaxID=1686743 RepID=UPI0023DB2C71|nr:pecanex-like protein 1 [Oppia nitens]